MKFEIRLAERVKELEVRETGHVRHGGDDFVALFIESLQVLAEKLERQLALCAGDRFADVVFNGLREIPESPREFADLAIHGGDQFLLVPMEDRPPLVLRLEIHEILGVAESSGVGSVVGPAHLGHDFGHLGEGGEDQASLVGESLALRQAGAVGQGAARPDCALVQMRQELRTDDSAERQISRCAEGGDSDAQRDPAMPDGPAQIRFDSARSGRP